MSFDWKTDETDWDKPEPPVEVRPGRHRAAAGEPVATERASADRGRQFLVFGVIVLLLLVAAAAVVYRQLDRRADATIERIRTDVLASQQTLTRAAQERDRELFIGFLSGRDDDWATAQERLVSRGRFLDRSDFAWTWLPEAAPPATVVVANDLLSAELQAPQRYTIDAGGGLTETITLTQTAVFRPATDRWLLAPPDDLFWGKTATVDGRYMSLAYPERDARIVERLAPALDAKLVELCTQVEGLDCPEGLRFDLTLSTDPGALDLSSMGTNARRARLTLPTPTLLGLPADAAAERALFRAYAVPLVNSALVGLGADQPFLYYGVLRAALLRQLDLAPWPLAETDFARLAREPEAAEALAAYWQMGTLPPADTIWPAYVLVDYLTRELGRPVVPMMRDLGETRSAGFGAWLARVSGGRIASAADFERELIRFAAAEATPADLPIPLPDQALQLACRPRDGIPALYRLDFATGAPQRLRALGEATWPMLVALPDDSGVIIAERHRSIGERATTLWRDDIESTLALPPDEYFVEGSLIPVTQSPATGTMTFIEDSLDTVFSLPDFWLLEPDECSGATCELQRSLGNPFWSANGRYALIAIEAESPLTSRMSSPLLFLADDRGTPLQSLEYAGSPFWVDDDTFGYVGNNLDHSGQPIILRSVDAILAQGQLSGFTSMPRSFAAADEADVMLSSINLRAERGGVSQEGLYVDRVLPVPGEPSAFIIATAEPLVPASTSQVFLFDKDTGDLAPRFEISDEPSLYQRHYAFSPDGRILLIVSLGFEPRADGSLVWHAYLHNLEANTTRTFTLEADPRWPGQYLVDWSADGRWLSLLTNGYVRLVSLDADWEQPLIVPDAVCSSAVWVN